MAPGRRAGPPPPAKPPAGHWVQADKQAVDRSRTPAAVPPDQRTAGRPGGAPPAPLSAAFDPPFVTPGWYDGGTW